MQSFLDWLYDTPLSQTFQTISWIIPLVQTVHIICLAVLFTSMMMLDLRLIGLAGTMHSVEYYTHRFLPWLWGTLPILFVTGLVLIIAEPRRSLENPVFYLKMSMLIVSCIVMYLFQRSVRKEPWVWESSGQRVLLGKGLGVVGLLLWVGIVVSGRLIAYV